jgi:hypothetical protein
MAICLCAVRRGEGLPTRPLDEAEDPSTVTVDGYDAPVGLLGDDRFEADVQLDGLAAWEVVRYEGDRVGRGAFDGLPVSSTPSSRSITSSAVIRSGSAGTSSAAQSAWRMAAVT